ncbi:MAG TPA: hypothetical protein VGQ89_04480 [Candidatus Limnocylindrales bacterium]|nr:hypothetical protein [Candidatus Limnocylindrales bacterium]
MSTTSLVFWLLGVALVAIGYTRARGPWARYQALREQQDNVSRYEAWRGGLRTQDDGPTGASVAMAEYRRQAQVAGIIAVIGFVLIFLGFALG